MPQHLQTTRITVKGFVTMKGVPAKMVMRPSVTWLPDLQLRKTKNSLDAIQCLCFLGGNNITISMHWPCFQKKTSLSPYLLH